MNIFFDRGTERIRSGTIIICFAGKTPIAPRQGARRALCSLRKFFRLTAWKLANGDGPSKKHDAVKGGNSQVAGCQKVKCSFLFLAVTQLPQHPSSPLYLAPFPSLFCHTAFDRNHVLNIGMLMSLSKQSASSQQG